MNPTNHDLNTLTLTHHYQNKPKNSDILLQVHSINVKAIIHNSPPPQTKVVECFDIFSLQHSEPESEAQTKTKQILGMNP